LPNGTLPSAVFDICGDCEGNFYVWAEQNGGAFFRKYNSAGTLQFSLPIINPPGSFNQAAGLGLINGEFFVSRPGFGGLELYKGTFTGSAMSISLVANFPGFYASDFATCPGLPFGQGTIASADTLYRCPGATGPLTVSVTGVAPFTWSVVSGQATLSSTTGSSIQVTPTAPTPAPVRLRVVGGTTACGYAVDDTVTILPLTVSADAGPARSITRCSPGPQNAQLLATLTDTLAGVRYYTTWAPTTGTPASDSARNPTVSPPATTTYTLTVRTDSARGGCLVTDTVTVVVDSLARAFSVQATRDTAFCEAPPTGYALSTIVTPTAGYYRYNWSGGPLIGGAAAATLPSPRPDASTPGTYTYYVTVADTFGCHSARDTVRLTFRGLGAALAPPAASLCRGDSVRLTAAGTPASAAWSYAWSPATGLSCTACASTVARPTETTRYGVRATHGPTGCVLFRTADVEITVRPDSFSAGPDVLARPGVGTGTLAPFTLEGTAPAAVSGLAWSPAEPLDQPFSARTGGAIDTTTAFVLTAFVGRSGGCRVADTAVVYYVGCAGLVLPNAFSPNGDGANEVFARLDDGTRFEARTLRIYNRWGTQVHAESGPALRGWDGTHKGTLQSAGVYPWIATGQCIDPATGTRQDVELTGTVTLVR